MEKCELAVKFFGLTDDIYEAGYIMPDGRMLDFSDQDGKVWGDKGEPHKRYLDHKTVGTAYGEDADSMDTMFGFIRDCKAVRVSIFKPEDRGAVKGCFYGDTIHKPTEEQLSVMSKAIKDNDCVVLEKRTATKGFTECFVDTKANLILNPLGTFIRKCYKEEI